MTLPAFSMQSPTALKKYNADDTQGTEDDPRFSDYATAHPTGTGPFVFEKWERGQQVTLKRNDSYWGDKAKVEQGDHPDHLRSEGPHPGAPGRQHRRLRPGRPRRRPAAEGRRLPDP